MYKEPATNEKDIQEIDSLVERLSGSAIEFRKTIYDIVFRRLSEIFKTKNIEITKDTRLKEIFNLDFTEAEWAELSDIELRIPGLQRAGLYRYLLYGYLAFAFVALVILVFKSVELSIIVLFWAQHVPGLIMIAAAVPPLLLMMVFKRKHLPCDTIDELVESIIAANWTELLMDDKKLFKELVREEEVLKRRTTSTE